MSWKIHNITLLLRFLSTISRFHKEVVVGGVIEGVMNSMSRQRGMVSLGSGGYEVFEHSFLSEILNELFKGLNASDKVFK